MNHRAEHRWRTAPARSAGARRAGFHIAREGAKHVVMTDGTRIVTIPRHDPVNAFTMGGIVRDAGLTEEEFRKLV